VLERIREAADIQSKMKAKILVLLFVMVAAAGFGDGLAVLVENAEAEDFYYTLDPPELAGFNPVGSVFSGILYDYFTEAGGETDFDLLAAGDTARLTALSEGAHLLVGFFVIPGETAYPVRVLRVQAGGGIEERFYTLYAEPSVFSARAGLGRLRTFTFLAVEPAAAGAGEAEEPAPAAVAAPTAPAAPAAAMAGAAGPGISIDNSYQDWEAVPFLAGFAESFAPASFTREEYGKSFQALPLADARHWPSGGTALSEIKAVSARESLYIFTSTRSAIADSLSFFLYIQSAAETGRENSVTLELVPASAYEPGVVVLWERGRPPRLAGRLFSGSFFLEAEIDLAPVRQALARTLSVSPEPGNLRVDLTSCYFDRGGLIYEEFFFSSLSLQDVPRLEEIAF
jgi:hypothetical protein